MMWTRGAAIRQVPAYAIVNASFLDRIEDIEGRADDDVISQRLTKLRSLQPKLFDDVQARVALRIDDLAKGLIVQMTGILVEVFDAAHPGRMRQIAEEDLRAAEVTMDVEEELRRERPDEPFELDDVVGREQPAIVAFMQRVLEGSLEAQSEHEIDLDDVHASYRKLLGYVLALSYAVEAPPGATRDLPA
ncbi:MAG: hypothetical protein ACRELY_13765 [Polyangiaceae bacterium]